MNVNDNCICISLRKGKRLLCLHCIIFLRIIVLIHTKLMVRKQVGNFFTCKLLNFSDNVFEPQSEVTEEGISKWRRDKHANIKLGMLHLREKHQNIWAGEQRIVFTLPFLSLHAQQHFDAGVLLSNAQRQCRIWICRQCLHKSIHYNYNRCFVYMLK